MVRGNTLFEGTWEEAIHHAASIPSNTRILILQLEGSPSTEKDIRQSKSLAERFAGRLGQLSFEPADGSEKLEHYLEGFGQLPEIHVTHDDDTL